MSSMMPCGKLGALPTRRIVLALVSRDNTPHVDLVCRGRTGDEVDLDVEVLSCLPEGRVGSLREDPGKIMPSLSSAP